MVKKANRKAIREKKHSRIRNRISGTAQCPRLAVYRSNKHIYAQIIDDKAGSTLVSASSLDKDVKSSVAVGSNIEAAKAVGKLVAERAKEKNIVDVVFDRGGFIYQGKVAALADAAREAGLEF